MIERPRPIVTEETAFYWHGAARGELLLQRCSRCGAVRHPPTSACPKCRGLHWTPMAATGRGVVYSFVRLRPPLVPGVEDGTIVAVIQLEEGPRIVTNIVESSTDAVGVGAPVVLCFEPLGDGAALPQFRVAATDHA